MPTTSTIAVWITKLHTPRPAMAAATAAAPPRAPLDIIRAATAL